MFIIIQWKSQFFSHDIPLYPIVSQYVSLYLWAMDIATTQHIESRPQRTASFGDDLPGVFGGIGEERPGCSGSNFHGANERWDKNTSKIRRYPKTWDPWNTHKSHSLYMFTIFLFKKSDPSKQKTTSPIYPNIASITSPKYVYPNLRWKTRNKKQINKLMTIVSPCLTILKTYDSNHMI